jgi:hypothetical protein
MYRRSPERRGAGQRPRDQPGFRPRGHLPRTIHPPGWRQGACRLRGSRCAVPSRLRGGVSLRLLSAGALSPTEALLRGRNRTLGLAAAGRRSRERHDRAAAARHRCTHRLRGHRASLRLTGACRCSCAAWAEAVATFRARSDSSRLRERAAQHLEPIVGLICGRREHVFAARLDPGRGFAEEPGRIPFPAPRGIRR